MATMTVSVQGLDRILARADKYREQAEQGVEQAFAAYALEVEAEAKRRAPVDTGRLRASIAHTLTVGNGRFEAEVGTNVEYAVYQEFGTSRTPAQPFLFPAAEASRAAFVRRLREALHIPA